MTSRDFGIVTLRNAVAYHFDGSIVPINNVYITSTNGGAVFSDTLTISTINVSTINGGGIGGGVSSITAGTNISITGTASDPIVNVDINSTLLMNGFPIYDNSTITIAAGSSINLSTLSTSIVLDQASQGITITSVPTTTINGNGATNAQLNINGSASIRGSTAQLEIYDGLSVQQGSLAYNVADTAIHLNAINQLDLTGDQGVALTANGGTGVVLTASGPGTGGSIRFRTLNPTGNLNVEIEGSISLTAGYNNNTGNINLYTASTSIILDQLASQSITITANNGINITGSTLINGTIKVASTFYDNNASSGTSGQVLTAGTGGQVVWSTITSGGGSMNVTISSGSGTYIIPGSGMYSVSYTAIGGGGGGGGGGSNYDPNPGAGGGGASGTLVSGTFITMAGSPLVYIIGAGGTGGNNAAPNGIAGVATTATLPSGYGTVTAAGGDLGTYNGNGGGNGGNGGAYGGGGGGYYGVIAGGVGGTGTIAGGGNGTSSGGAGGAGGGGAPGGSGGAYGGGGGGGGWAGGAGGSGGGGGGGGGGGYGSGGGGGGSNGGLGATNPGGNGSGGVILLTLTSIS